MKYGVNGVWEQAVLGQGTSGLGNMTVIQTFYRTSATVTKIPVLFPQSVLAGDAAGYAYSCVTAALRALFRGWGGW